MRGIMLGYCFLEEYAHRRGVKKKDIAQLLGVSPKTIWNKLRGANDFTLGEAIKIKNRFFPDMPIEEIFKREVPIEQLFEREAPDA